MNLDGAQISVLVTGKPRGSESVLRDHPLGKPQVPVCRLTARSFHFACTLESPGKFSEVLNPWLGLTLKDSDAVSIRGWPKFLKFRVCLFF